jgi:ribosomal protein L11 methylase PrmA
LTARVAGSFRDPAGFVFTRDGVLYRQINHSFRERYDAVCESGLYDALVSRGLIVGHETVDVEPADPSSAALVIKPERVAFISYPFEWSPGQLQAAALLTLEVQRLAMEHGMSLRDASAYNVQFHRGRPVLIDTLSFEPLVEGKPWVAYAQFCQHFLAPLALMHHVDVRLGELLRIHLDGIPLDLAATLLPGRTRLQPGLTMHIHAHASSQQKYADAGATEGGTGKERTVSRNAMVGLINSLENAVRKQQWEPPPSAWRDYYAAKESYSDEALQHKEELVAKAVADAAPSTVWDLGGNTGRFSRIAAQTGADVVTLEMDPSAVELNWRQVVENNETSILPLVCDLSNPTPSQGWAHRERPSITERGPADLGLALALLHHIAIGGNVPLPDIAEWFSTLCKRLVVEWIPKEDPMVRRLLASREDVFADYHQEGFEQAIEPFFTIESSEAVRASVRTMYVLSSRTG